MTCVQVGLGPACVNLTGIRAGDRNEITVALTSGGAPLNLTGLTPTAQARKVVTDLDALEAVVTVTDAAAGQLTLRWPGDLVTTWLAGKSTQKGVWDLQLDNGTDDPITVVAGTLDAVMDVTR